MAPFVVADEESGDDDPGEDGEENLHDALRIARDGGESVKK